MTRNTRPSLLPWLDVVAIAAWGFLFLKYWLTGRLYLLIHPNYTWLTVVAGFALVGLAAVRAVLLLCRSRTAMPAGAHLSLFPPGWSSGLLLATALVGLLVTPRAFASQTAIDRGVTDSLTLTRVRPQTFRASTRTEDKSLIDWIRTLHVYPEPDAYTGQKVKIQGFVTYPPNLPEQYFLITRFVITCCAADVYPVSLPVKIEGNRKDYPADTWLEVQGQMITDTLAGKRQLTIQAKSLQRIPEPKNPYDY